MGNFDCALNSWGGNCWDAGNMRVFTWGMFEGPWLLNLAHIPHLCLINHPGRGRVILFGS